MVKCITRAKRIHFFFILCCLLTSNVAMCVWVRMLVCDVCVYRRTRFTVALVSLSWDRGVRKPERYKQQKRKKQWHQSMAIASMNQTHKYQSACFLPCLNKLSHSLALYFSPLFLSLPLSSVPLFSPIFSSFAIPSITGMPFAVEIRRTLHTYR